MADRYEDGLERLRSLAGAEGDRIHDNLRDLSPDLARLVVEFGYGEIYGREGELDLRTRQLVAIAALAAIGGADAQVEYHVRIALGAGVAPREIVETLIHLLPFVGFARVLNAARSVRRAFAALDVEP